MRTIILLIVVLSLASCDSTKETQTNVTASEEGSVKESSEANIRIIETYFKHFNNHDWAAMANMYADTAEFKDPSLGPDLVKQSVSEVEEKYRELGSTFQDVHDEIKKIYPSGDRYIIVEFVSTGTAPDGSEFELPICTIFEISGGKIVKDFTYYDNF